MGLSKLLCAGALVWALLAGPVGSEEIPPGYCHVGAYELSDGSQIVISPSDPPNLRYRRLDGVSGKLFPIAQGRYDGGEGWASRTPVTVSVSFTSCSSSRLAITRRRGPTVHGRRIGLPVIPVTFSNGGVALQGEFVLPADQNPRAIVVLQYGSGRDSAIYGNYLQHLLPLRGIAVLIFDKRGTGRSSGHFSADFRELAGDLAAAVDAVRRRPEANGVPVGVLGESQGGWVAPLAASQTNVDFVVVSYGLAISPAEEDRQEVLQSLTARGFVGERLDQAEELHRASMRVVRSKFTEGLHDLERLKALYRHEPWFAGVGGDLTGTLASTSAGGMADVRAQLDFPFDLDFDPEPGIAEVDVPMLWVLAGRDTEAPHETTLALLRRLQGEGHPIDIAVFPNADHGMIEQTGQLNAPQALGRHSPGYLDLLHNWIVEKRLQRTYGNATLYRRQSSPPPISRLQGR